MMLRHYLKTGWRHLRTAKIFSLINIFGLTIGLTCSMLILLFVKDESSFDQFHQQADQIYRITSENTFKGETTTGSNTGLLEGPRFTQHVPGIKAFVRFTTGGADIKKGTEIIPLGLKRTDPNFFDMFDFPLLAGNPETCLESPNGIVLSRSEAIRQFGTPKALGKTLLLREDSTFQPYTVTAIAKDCPENSSLRFDALMKLRSTPAELNDPNNWFNFYLNTFVLLDTHADPAKVQQQMQSYYQKDAAATFHSMLKQLGLTASDVTMETYHLQPLTAMHTDTDMGSSNGVAAPSNPMYTYILGGIAIFILLIACINFINLTITRSIKRAKEIGIRKVVGSGKKQLIIQFMGESILQCLMAFLLALLLTIVLLPVFNTLAGKSLALSYLMDGWLVAELIALFLVTSFIAGFYPAIVLTRLEPTKILYNRFQVQGKNYLQKTLVVVQFTLATVMVVMTFVLYRQFNFLTNADLGYDDSNLVLVEHYDSDARGGALFKKLLVENPGIKEVVARESGVHLTIGKIGADQSLNFRQDKITADFLTGLKIPFPSGRNFSSATPTDSIDKVIVNEAFVKAAGWQQPLGEKITLTTEENKIVQVIGVVKNYHSGSLNQAITPQLFRYKDINELNSFYIRLGSGQSGELMDYIKSSYLQSFPLTHYYYSFVEQNNKMLYGDIQRWRQMLLFGSLITILLSIMGLFGLSVLSSQRRKKEIGIRKVYGASVSAITKLLTTDYLKRVLLAMAIATPITLLAARKFLNTMLYRIPLSVDLFLIPDLAVILLAFLTVFVQTRQSATVNPVKSLKND